MYKSKEAAALRLMKPALLAAALGCAGSAWAVESGQIVAGNGGITTAGNTTTISQSTDKMIVNWKNFDVASGQTVNIQQPNAKSAILNRVTGSSAATQIDGNLNANGRVFVVNPNGVMIGSGAQVNVDSLVASSLNIEDAQFLRNGTDNYDQAMDLTGTGKQGAVTNQGTINAAHDVVLAGSQASNSGKINAGSVSMDAADSMYLLTDKYGGHVSVYDASANAQVQNSGAIVSKIGNVELRAAAAGDAIRTVVRNTGTIEANTAVVEKGGNIVLNATRSGDISVDGKLTADNNVSAMSYNDGSSVSVNAPIVS